MMQLLRARQQMSKCQMLFTFKLRKDGSTCKLVFGVRTCSHHRRIRRGLNPGIFTSYRLARGSFCIFDDLHVLPTFCGLCSAHLRIRMHTSDGISRWGFNCCLNRINIYSSNCGFVNHNSYGLGNSPSSSQHDSQPSASNRIIHSNQPAIY